jgi:hypothetical protein
MTSESNEEIFYRKVWLLFSGFSNLFAKKINLKSGFYKKFKKNMAVPIFASLKKLIEFFQYSRVAYVAKKTLVRLRTLIKLFFL